MLGYANIVNIVTHSNFYLALLDGDGMWSTSLWSNVSEHIS